MEFLELLWTAYKVLGGVLGRVRIVAYLASLVVKRPSFRFAY